MEVIFSHKGEIRHCERSKKFLYIFNQQNGVTINSV